MNTRQDKSFHFLLWLFAAIVLFSIILVFNKDFYAKITNEDHIVEYLGFVLLLIAGIFIVAAGVTGILEKKRHFWSSSLLIVIGLIFIAAAFEEISWGQRLLGFDTPEKLVPLNDQNEFNLHNIDKKFFDRLVDRLNILFVYFATIMLMLKRPQFWHVRLPNTYVILAFAIIPFYHQYNQVHFDFYHLLYLPIAVLLIRSFNRGNHKEFAANLLTLLFTILLFWLHTSYNHLFPTHNNSANEVRETLFSLVCAYYAYIIYDDVKWDRVTFGFF